MLSLGQTVETQIGDSNKHERERNRNRPPVVTRLGETQPDYDGPRYQRHQHSHIEHQHDTPAPSSTLQVIVALMEIEGLQKKILLKKALEGESTTTNR